MFVKVKMKKIIGLHKLSGFDDDIQNKGELKDGVCFVVDDKKYQTYKSPYDLYSSYMNELFQEDIKCKNNFNPEDVFIIYEDSAIFQGLIFYNMLGEIIIILGTDSPDGWDTVSIKKFYPKNLLNKKG